MSMLADKKAAAAKLPDPKIETMLSRKRASSPRGEFVELPFFGRVWVELVSEAVVDEIESAVWAIMKGHDLPPTGTNVLNYGGCRDALTLAWAVRNPDALDEKYGTQEEWRALDVDLIYGCAFVYRDVRERLSPVQLGELSREQLDEIRHAVEKKNPTPLLDAGVVALSSYLLTTAAQPSSSPTTPSSSGESQ